MGRHWPALLLFATLAAGTTLSCAADIRMYDMDRHGYHAWNRDTIALYTRWEMETSREHKDLRARTSEDQKEFWAWRQNQ
jgi:hypothetical protein